MKCIQDKLGKQYLKFEEYYQDTHALYYLNNYTIEEKSNLLYRIYLSYFRALSLLPYKIRRKVHADSYIKKMKKLVKNDSAPTKIDSYWFKFLIQCVPAFLIAFAGEMILLQLDALIWKIIGSILMIGGFAAYFILAYELEGQRIFSSLFKWTRYKISPREYSRPLDLVQTLKTLFPLIVAIGSAIVKLYKPS